VLRAQVPVTLDDVPLLGSRSYQRAISSQKRELPACDRLEQMLASEREARRIELMAVADDFAFEPAAIDGTGLRD
jgi:hypothetical protein